MSDKELDETIAMLTKEKQKRARCAKVIYVGPTHYEFLDKEGQQMDAYKYRHTYEYKPIEGDNFGLFPDYNLCDEVKLRCSVGALVTTYEHIIKVLYETGYILKYVYDGELVFIKKCHS